MTFLDLLLHSFCVDNGVDYALVATLQRDTPGLYRVFACSSGSIPLGRLSFEIAGTFFEAVMAHEEYAVDAGAQSRFSIDRVLKHFDAQACVGLRLKGQGEDAMGIVAVLNKSPMAAAEGIKSSLRTLMAEPSFLIELAGPLGW